MGDFYGQGHYSLVEEGRGKRPNFSSHLGVRKLRMDYKHVYFHFIQTSEIGSFGTSNNIDLKIKVVQEYQEEPPTPRVWSFYKYYMQNPRSKFRLKGAK